MTSSRPRAFRCEGVVLRHRDMGEADRLITLLTPDHGIVRAVARGARKPTSKTGGHLDLLRHVSLTVSEGRAFRTVGQVESVEGHRSLRDDLGRMSRGIYFAELAERFSVEDAPNAAVFRLLARSLGLLEKTPAPDLLTRWFETRLLHLSGFLPQFTVCADCGRGLAQQDHVFSAERGGILCPDCKPAGSDVLLPAGVPAIKLLRHLARSEWGAVEALRIPLDDLHQVERVLRAHLRYVVDHKINSAAFMDEVRKWRDGGASSPSPTRVPPGRGLG
jgi:DNA repair protein RecO (recombination protein O)